MSSKLPPMPGAAIDAVLAPFVQDEADLHSRLENTQRQIDELQAEADQIGRDLEVIRSAKVEALRQAAAEDPLLSQAFMGPIGQTSDAEPDRHPLLSPTG
ncbi:MAG: hypothetical protein AAGL98_04805 [Planctomycetota bacterium]